MFPFFFWLFVVKVACGERAGKASAVVASGRGFSCSCAACYYVITLFLHFRDSSSSCPNGGGASSDGHDHAQS